VHEICKGVCIWIKNIIA